MGGWSTVGRSWRRKRCPWLRSLLLLLLLLLIILLLLLLLRRRLLVMECLVMLL